MNTHTLEKGLNLSRLLIKKKKCFLASVRATPPIPLSSFSSFSSPSPLPSLLPSFLPFFLPLLPSPFFHLPPAPLFLSCRVCVPCLQIPWLGVGVFQLDVLSAQLP